DAAVAAFAGGSAASGLFLIQFSVPLSQDARAGLAAAGVELLHYVPDGAFVARFHGANIRQVQALPYVHWIGRYRPEHKVQRLLHEAAAQRKGDELIAVGALLAPRASAADVAEVRRAFAGVQQESALRSGTVLRGEVSAAKLD